MLSWVGPQIKQSIRMGNKIKYYTVSVFISSHQIGLFRCSCHLAHCHIYHMWKKYITRIGTNNENGNKLQTYMTFKTEFGHEGYLDHVERLDDRKYLSRLRTSSHNLKIETGRHTRPKTPVENRVWQHCNILEDEFHFLLMCNRKSRYVTVRESFFQELTNINPSFVNICDTDRFIYIMSSEDKDVCEITGRFVHKIVLVIGSL